MRPSTTVRQMRIMHKTLPHLRAPGAAALLLVGSGVAAAAHSPVARTDTVAPVVNGGIETLVTTTPGQVVTIRSQLQQDARRFSAGNFSTRNVGPSIPELRAGAGRIHITYAAVSHGGQLRYATTDPVLVIALHEWIAARNGHTPSMPSQARIDQRSKKIMTFDLTKTMHGFQDLPTGGLETVMANDATDATQIALVRGHLRKEATLFSQGDFSGPAYIHGDDMPGLPELWAGWTRLAVRYAPLSNGASIRYTTTDPVMVAAIHQWFAAQTMEHGTHAMHM